MTTSEEFQKAMELVNSCKATIKCGCKYDKDQAEQLAYICKWYLKAVENQSL